MRQLISYFGILCYFYIIPGECYAALDTKAMASEETEAWKAYYAKDSTGLFKHMEKLLVLQFGLVENDPKTAAVAGKFVMAMAAFGEKPNNSSLDYYKNNVLPLVLEAYTALRDAIHATWNPKEVAESDLDWWVARRDPSTNNPESVAKKIAKLYGLLYGKNVSNHFSKAAYLRAAAARYRDLCRHEWSIDQEDWSIIRTMLEKSYLELSLGIQ